MRTLFPLLLATCIATASAQGVSTGPSNASGASVGGSAVVVMGSMSVLAAGSDVVVESVEAVADGVQVVLKGAGQASKATVKLSGQAARNLSAAAWQAIQVTAVSTGHMLVASGKVLAFIPNEAGKALLHHSRAN